VRPDFAHKHFGDKRMIYVLLMVALAQDFPAALSASAGCLSIISIFYTVLVLNGA
jgi:hypothetical protein